MKDRAFFIPGEKAQRKEPYEEKTWDKRPRKNRSSPAEEGSSRCCVLSWFYCVWTGESCSLADAGGRRADKWLLGSCPQTKGVAKNAY